MTKHPACETVALNKETVRRAGAMLRAGGLVAFPTETVYGLGGDARNDAAVAGIFAAKGRPSFNPLIIHIPDVAGLEPLAELPARARTLTDAFWPGPLTLVLRQRPDSGLSRLACAGLATVAVRAPAHKGAQAVLRAAGCPVAAPSANLSGRLSPTMAAHVAALPAERVDLVLDGGACPLGLESSIIDMTGERPMLLRAGALTLEAIAACLGEEIDEIAGPDHANAPAAPGMSRSHYAPCLPLRLNATRPRAGEAYLAFGADAPAGATATLSAGGDLVEAAASLFRLLHDLDDPGRYRGIAVAPIPGHGLGRAINDRLMRATAPPC